MPLALFHVKASFHERKKAEIARVLDCLSVFPQDPSALLSLLRGTLHGFSKYHCHRCIWSLGVLQRQSGLV